MQIFNKEASKRILVHTWYIYPLVTILVSVLLVFAFQAYHQPSAHQMLTLFLATEVFDTKFVDDISSNYKKEDLRKVTAHYALSSATGFANKLQLYMNVSDLLILDEVTLNKMEGHYDGFFFEIKSEIKEQYFKSDALTYTNSDKDYGILIKEKNKDSNLSKYMLFDETVNYYLLLSVGSKNMGVLSGEENKNYTNGLTFASYLFNF